ncbi:MAG: N-acetylmuramoyl-L-alanine amidase AmiB [Candidatus Rifleibacteriota bacterium]
MIIKNTAFPKELNICVKIVFLIFLIANIPFTSNGAEKGRITDIRFWQSPEEAQVVLDISQPPRVSSVSRLKDGTLYFDIADCKFRPGRQRYPLKNPFLEVLTVQQKSRDLVRIFFRVPEGVEAKTFVLPKNDRKGDRIVIFLKEPRASMQQRRSEELKAVKKLKAENIKIVVLDPGHGGEDPGTRNNGIIEKNYVLNMGKLIKAYFDRDPRFKAILTRSGDYIIPLQRRREISEHLGADAFVSLHVNYNRKKSIRGIEVYYESPKGAVGEAERIVAETENMVDFAGADNHNVNSTVTKREIVEKQASIMFKSRQLAEKVESRLSGSVSGLPSRGVKRAGFKVLHSMAMPSILVEFAYTSNPEDAKILKNYTYRTRMAQAVYLGIRDFLLGNIEEGIDTTYLAYIKQAEERKAKLARAREARRKKLERDRKRARKHSVRKGETLSGIAAKYNVSLKSLLKLNGFSSKHIIKIGDIVLIPRK